MGLKNILGNMFWKKQENKIFMVGMPDAGKTVFFCVCMDFLQQSFNEMGKDYSVTYPPDTDTQELVHNVISTLERQEWPMKTDKNDGVQKAVAHISYAGSKKEITSKEYGGEVFEDVFIYRDKEFNDRENEVQKEFLDDIKAASSIAVLIGLDMLKDNTNKDLYKGLLYMIGEIRKESKLSRLALIITKNDIEKMTPDEAEKKFMRQYPNIYAHIKEMKTDYQFFTVSIGPCIPGKGDYIPPENYSPLKHSQGIDDAVYWLLEMKKPA